MPHRHSHSHARPRRSHDRHVRFSLPLDARSAATQPTLTRAGTPRLREQVELDSALLRRRSSLGLRPHHERLLRAQEALHDMRAFLEGTCNFHGDEKRRALTVPSVAALSSLVAFVNALRGNVDAEVTRRFETILRHAGVDLTARHPHDQLAVHDTTYMNVHERNARRGHTRRMCREAEWRLLEFVSRQLQFPLDFLRDLPVASREQHELDAFKERLRRFNVPRPPPGVLRDGGGTNSVPQSPVERRYTEPRPPGTDPPPYLRRAFDMHPDDELFPQMGDLSLPAPVRDLGLGASLPSHSRLPPQPPSHAGRTSPYTVPTPSPYASAATYTPPVTTADAYMHTSQPPQTPPQPYAASPYVGASAYMPQTYAATQPRPATAYPGTPPQAPAGYPPGVAYVHPGHNGGVYAHPPSWQGVGPANHEAHGAGVGNTAPSPYMYPQAQAAGMKPAHGGGGQSPYNVPRRR